MATSTGSPPLAPTAPADTVHGPDDSMFMVMSGLGQQPASGRLLRGLAPYLDEHGARNVFLLAERKRKEHWRGDDTRVAYQELIHWARDAKGGVFRGVCSKGSRLSQEAVTERFQADPLKLIDWAAGELKAATISSATPLRLRSLQIEKPWGQEGWYTGVEARGICRIGTDSGDTELPYALGMFPVPLTGSHDTELILLKTLEPRPEPILGDLYLEVHKKKWETYLVLDVNRRAWRNGTGYLRAGIDADMLKRYRKTHADQAEDELVHDMGEKIAAYEKVRREIDAHIDEALKARGLSLLEPAPEDLTNEVMRKLPAKLKEREAKLRAEAEAFVGRHPLREADVACLPPGVLHSLQHGVKVVEFQTPTYERLIAMFAQKVVTQPHWDTEKALACMQKAPYDPPATTALLSDQDGVKRDRVVDFPQFHVVRTRLAPGTQLEHVPAAGDAAYRLVYITHGTGRIVLPGGAEFLLARGEACLLPAMLQAYTIHAGFKQGLTFLTAHPWPADKP